MKKYVLTLEHFQNLIEKDREIGSLQVVKQYFDDCIGMGEMYLNLIEIRQKWYVVNTDIMTIDSVEDFAEQLIYCVKGDNDFIICWLDDYYDTYLSKGDE